MTQTIKTLCITAALAVSLTAAGCNTASGPVKGGSISPTQQPDKKKLPSNLVKLKSGTPPLSTLVGPGGDVTVYDDSTHVPVWSGTVKPNTVVTVAPDGVYLNRLKGYALKNPSAKHTIYFVKPTN